jgi:cytosine/adenosine deaminase-related metal-dependent hydrolase
MACNEEELLGRAGVTAVFNSSIAARRGLSPRIAELEAAGCLIAMGTDNMSEDMVEVMRTGMFMERIRRGDGRSPLPEQALRWATTNGYRALGIEDGGWLAPGNLADLIVVDLRRAHLVPVTRPVSTFLHQGQSRDIESVMIDGRWIMREHRILTMDEDKIVAEADRIGRRAWTELFEGSATISPPTGFLPLQD